MENIKMMLAEIDELDKAFNDVLSVFDIDTDDMDEDSDIPALFEEFNSRQNRLRGMVMAHVK